MLQQEEEHGAVFLQKAEAQGGEQNGDGLVSERFSSVCRSRLCLTIAEVLCSVLS